MDNELKEPSLPNRLEEYPQKLVEEQATQHDIIKVLLPSQVSKQLQNDLVVMGSEETGILIFSRICIPEFGYLFHANIHGKSKKNPTPKRDIWNSTFYIKEHDNMIVLELISKLFICTILYTQLKIPNFLYFQLNVRHSPSDVFVFLWHH